MKTGITFSLAVLISIMLLSGCAASPQTSKSKDIPNDFDWLYAQNDFCLACIFMDFEPTLKQAKQGDAKAQSDLCYFYKEDKDKRDYREAARWCLKAAEQGSLEAFQDLGWLYRTGNGVPRDDVYAYAYYNVLAASGWWGAVFAKSSRDFIAEELTPNQIAEAQRISRELAKLVRGNDKKGKTHSDPEKNATPEPGKQRFSGTGWPTAQGYVVTNYYVVENAKEIILVRPDGAKIHATVEMVDQANDIALLRAQAPNKLPPALPISNSRAKVGSSVFTIGYPHPDVMGADPKLTSGKINALTGIQNDPRTYQISVPTQSGNSGGPLFNMNGEVVGVVTSKLSAVKMFKWTGDLPQNVNYAVKVGYVKMLIESAPEIKQLRVLSSKKDSLESLVERVKGSILMVIAEVKD